MWFKNLRIYRLSPSWSMALAALEDALAKEAFRPVSSLAMQSLGWVPSLENGSLAHSVEGQLLLSMRTEKRLLPSTVINQVVRARADEIEAQQGYAPGRKQLKELKETVTDDLLPKAFSLYRDTSVWIDTRHHWLVIDAAAIGKADEVLGLLSETINPLPVLPLNLARSPASAMTQWLLDDEAPANFSIDQDIELRASDESRAVVRYLRHNANPDEIRKHVEDGKQCTRLALTWADRLSFVLTDDLSLKRIAPLEVLTEKTDTMSSNEQEVFDADFTLMTGELANMLDDLVHALGGEEPLPGTQQPPAKA